MSRFCQFLEEMLRFSRRKSKSLPPPIMFSERSLITETQIIQVATMNISQLSPETHKIQVAISNITLLLVRQCMFIYSMFISLRRRSKIINDFIYNQRVHKFQSPPPPPPLLWQNVTIFILSQWVLALLCIHHKV